MRGKKGKADFEQDTFKRCPEFRMIRDVAEASNHAELNRTDVVVFGISGIGSLGEATTISPLGSFTAPPPCTRQIDRKDGTSYMMEDVLAIAAKFLRAEIR